MPHPFQCRCGALQGEVTEPRRGVRAVCHCGDCQAYAHLLGEPDFVLDAAGGSDIVASPASTVRITAGAGQLACLSLSPRGILRWYTRCCRTPVANTPRDWRLPYVGLVHTVLERPQPMAASYPPALVHVNRQSACAPAPRGDRPVAGYLRFFTLMGTLLLAKMTGRHRSTPFFDAEGRPVAPVEVAERDDVQAARAKVQAARGLP